ncbi:MAG: hypothetical protein R3E86_11880 [Pseudomonadales bacterium]
MYRFPSPLRTVAATVLAMTAIGGCATSGNSYFELRERQVARIAGECYWQREGERLVYGPAPVYAACRQWARSQVAVRMPSAVGTAANPGYALGGQ